VKSISDLVSDLPDDLPVDEVIDRVREDLNNAIPDFDLGVPALDDLIDFWRPREVD